MASTLKVLIIDDDEDDYFITSKYLKEVEGFPMEISWCYNIQEAKKELKSNQYDFYFLDYCLFLWCKDTTNIYINKCF